MQLIPQTVEAGSPVAFKLQGFPDEVAVISSLERQYRGQSGWSRQFMIYNSFNELIISGQMDESGRVGGLKHEDRRDESKYKKD